MAEFPCIECTEECENDVLECHNCKNWVHRNCVKMTPSAFRVWAVNSRTFLCKKCCFSGDIFDAEAALESMPVTRQKRFLLLYGSQTGQAKAIAEEIAERAEENSLHVDIHCLSMTEKKFFIEREECVVIVTSTTGDGEPPDTALKFIRRLKKKTLPSNYLAHLNYALLGLGDSNYTNFCNCARNLDKRLQDLGAQRFYDCGWADDAVGLEVAVEPWIDGLWAAVKRQLYGPNSDPNISDHSREVIKLNSSEPVLSALDELHSRNSQQNGFCLVKPTAEDESQSCETVIDRTGRRISESTAQLASVVENSVVVTTTENGQTVTGSDLLNIEKKEKNSEKEILSATSKLNGLSLTDQLKAVDTLTASENSNPNTTTVVQSNSTELNVNQSCHLSNSLTNLSNDISSCDIKTPKNISKPENNPIPRTETDKSTATSVLLSVPNIRQSVPLLSDSNLGVPVLSPAYLKIDYDSGSQMETSELNLQNGCQFPSAASAVAMATLISAEAMTASNAVKKSMMVQLDISEYNIQYEPGDSFSVICPNNPEEVDNLLDRLGLLDSADKVYQLSVLSDTKKKNAAIPRHVPDRGTLRHIFTTCLDIREPPKKALLRVLVEYTTEDIEKRRLQELCSRQGSDDYSKFVREPSLSLLDILNHFTSCFPPVERVVEHVPRLQPRPYSVCSSQLLTPGLVEFVFNVVKLDSSDGRTYSRKGVCTGWLEKFETSKNKPDVNDRIDSCSIMIDVKIPIFTRTSQHFHLPSDPSTPIIMVGPGTGVAPFLGFLRHRAALSGAEQVQSLGEAWLFYGCRHRDRDYLYRDELHYHHKSGNLTQLCVSFSRDDQPVDSPRYVQDNIRTHGSSLVKLIDESEAIVYVCGDARNMAKDVGQAFLDIFSTVKGFPEDEAKKYIMQLRLKKRYLEDVWT